MKSAFPRIGAPALGMLCVFSAAAGAAEAPGILVVMEVGVAAIALLILLARPGLPRRAILVAIPLALLFLLAVVQAIFPAAAVPGPGELKLSIGSLAPTETTREALKLGAYLIAFLLAARFAAERKLLLALLTPICAGAGFLAFYGILQFFSGYDLPFLYPRRLWEYESRLASSYVNPNHFAGYLEMCIPLSIALLATIGDPAPPASRRARLRTRIGAALSRLSREPGRGFLGLSLLFMGIALFFTQSRSGIFACLAGLLFIGIRLGRREKRLGRFAVLLLIVIATFAASIALGLDPIGDRLSDFGRNAPNRLLLWKDTLSGITDRYWLTGAGLGTYLFTFPEYQTGLVYSELAEAHNDYLNLWWEAGVAGVLFAGAFVIGVLRTAFSRNGRHRKWRSHAGSAAAAGVIAILLHSLTDFNLQVPANGLLFAVCAGITIGTRRNSVKQ